MSTADLSELICPECDRPCDDHASDCSLPEGTGSEPRRWSLYEHPQLGWKVAERDPPDGHDRAELATLNGWPVVEVQEVVGSAHDEQTEDPDPESKSWAQGFDAGVLAVLVWLTHQAEVSQPSEAVALLDLRDRIRKHFEQRFGSSVSGGE